MTATITRRRPRHARELPIGRYPSTLLPAWVDAVPLSPRERDVVQYVADFRGARKVSPTLAEVADAMGVSRVTIYQQVHAAARKGVLLIDRHKARSLRLAAGGRLAASPEGAMALRNENSVLREMAARAMSLMRTFISAYDSGGNLTGSREVAKNGRWEMVRLANQIEAALKPDGPGNGSAAKFAGKAVPA